MPWIQIKIYKTELSTWKTNTPQERKRLALKMRLQKSQVTVIMRYDEGDVPSRRTREPTPSMLEYKQIIGFKYGVGKPSKELKNATKYVKISDPPICNGKTQN